MSPLTVVMTSLAVKLSRPEVGSIRNSTRGAVIREMPMLGLFAWLHLRFLFLVIMAIKATHVHMKVVEPEAHWVLLTAPYNRQLICRTATLSATSQPLVQPDDTADCAVSNKLHELLLRWLGVERCCRQAPHSKAAHT